MKITSRYIDIPSVRIDTNNIPENLRDLLPLAKKWAIGDDVKRSYFISQTSKEEKKEFLKKVLSKIDGIELWCTEQRKKIPVPDETVLFDDMMEAFRDVDQDLNNRYIIAKTKFVELGVNMSEKMKITPLGVYKVNPNKKAFKDALFTWFNNKDRANNDLGNIVLIELKIENAPKDFKISDISLEDSDQAPYDERFFGLGYKELSVNAFEIPKEKDFILCFYLHYYEPNKKLITPYGEYNLPSISNIPDKFKHLKYEYFD